LEAGKESLEKEHASLKEKEREKEHASLKESLKERETESLVGVKHL